MGRARRAVPLRARRAAPVLVLVVLAALTTGCGAAGDRPGMTIFPDMMRSVPYDAYDPNPVFADGATLRHPPEGTVPVSREPFLYGTGTAEAVRAARDLHNPLEPTRDNLARGRQVFESICQVCHGSGGEGDGPVIGRFPNPPSLLSQHTRRYPDGRIYHVITRGQGIMPPHALQVLPDDRWRLVMYIRQLQEEAGGAVQAEAPEAPAAGDGDGAGTVQEAGTEAPDDTASGDAGQVDVGTPASGEPVPRAPEPDDDGFSHGERR